MYQEDEAKDSRGAEQAEGYLLLLSKPIYYYYKL
jgi:hypothetical protein